MKQQCLFNEEINIPGLIYISNYISSELEEKLLKLINAQSWNSDLKRKTQHYGYKYDYTTKSVNAYHYLGKIPDLIDELCHKLYSQPIFIAKPDQVIINEYMPGYGIASHIDCVPCFADTICSLSLASGCVMDLTNGNIKKPMYGTVNKII